MRLIGNNFFDKNERNIDFKYYPLDGKKKYMISIPYTKNKFKVYRNIDTDLKFHDRIYIDVENKGQYGFTLLNIEKELPDIFIIPETNMEFNNNIFVCKVEKDDSVNIIYKIKIDINKMISKPDEIGWYTYPISEDGYHYLTLYINQTLERERQIRINELKEKMKKYYLLPKIKE